MKAWSCSHCSAEVKEEEEKPEFCPICKKAGNWEEIELPDLTETEKEYTKKYEEVIETIEKYEEGTPPRKLVDAACCGVDHNEKRHKKHS